MSLEDEVMKIGKKLEKMISSNTAVSARRPLLSFSHFVLSCDIIGITAYALVFLYQLNPVNKDCITQKTIQKAVDPRRVLVIAKTKCPTSTILYL